MKLHRVRVTQAGNQFIDLTSGQLATLTGLGTLGNNLQHFCTGEIGRGYTKTSGCNLLDLGINGAVAGWISPSPEFERPPRPFMASQ